ncbi:MAG: phosphoribosylaminoimidazolesuccinocarboxamide synthase [Candidatus Micrarchaeia archaeon]
MISMETITETKLPLKTFNKGKVRETYEIDTNLLMIATDRLSAFDVVFNEGIPFKGTVLNSLSVFWFLRTGEIIRNHFITTAIPATLPKYLERRSMIVLKTEPIKLECVVRGYLTGSALKEYEKTGKVCGIELPKGLKNGDELPHPIFTPSTKAEKGHDENVDEEKAKKIVGEDTFNTIKEKSIALYQFGKSHAKKSGLVLADTKFEFGHHTNSEGVRSIILIDEILTPDSSRYWLKEKYDQGILESLDKQYVRDYLEKIKWNKSPPPPELPKDVIDNTTARYLQAYKMLTGREIDQLDTEASLEA